MPIFLCSKESPRCVDSPKTSDILFAHRTGPRKPICPPRRWAGGPSIASAAIPVLTPLGVCRPFRDPQNSVLFAAETRAPGSNRRDVHLQAWYPRQNEHQKEAHRLEPPQFPRQVSRRCCVPNDRSEFCFRPAQPIQPHHLGHNRLGYARSDKYQVVSCRRRLPGYRCM